MPTAFVRCGRACEGTALNAANVRFSTCNREHKFTSPIWATYKMEREISRNKVDNKLGYIIVHTAVLSAKKLIHTTDAIEQELIARQLGNFNTPLNLKKTQQINHCCRALSGGNWDESCADIGAAVDRNMFKFKIIHSSNMTYNFRCGWSSGEKSDESPWVKAH